MGLLPLQNEKYAVFNQIVYSPCEGEVLDIEDKWPNETPWSGNPPYNVGNHVLIISDKFGVLMGHLQKGSIIVKVGERVKKGQAIAQVGNSGWTSQPHLHIQAIQSIRRCILGLGGITHFFRQKEPGQEQSLFRKLTAEYTKG